MSIVDLNILRPSRPSPLADFIHQYAQRQRQGRRTHNLGGGYPNPDALQATAFQADAEAYFRYLAIKRGVPLERIHAEMATCEGMLGELGGS